jgi:AcrR family transcriptional regulator
MTHSISTEEKIVAAAKNVFLKQGFAGARMQDIADAAGINKALLHYYFRNKDKLFEMIFMQSIQKMIPTINSVFDSDDDLFLKIRKFVAAYTEMLSDNPYLPLFIANELSKNPEKIIKMIMTSANDKPHINKFIKDIQSAIELDIIKPISTINLFINIMSLCIFPYIAKPMMQFFLKLDELEYRMILEQRKQEVADFIIDSIKK